MGKMEFRDKMLEELRTSKYITGKFFNAIVDSTDISKEEARDLLWRERNLFEALESFEKQLSGLKI